MSRRAADEILFLPCAAGVEQLLEAEVRKILGGDVRCTPSRGGVAVRDSAGRARMHALRLNLWSRLAQRVLWRVAEGPYRDETDVLAYARSVRWIDWITPRQTLRVDVTAQRSPLRSLRFAALRVKDGLCDAMRDATGERPSVDTRRPDLPLVLHLGEQELALYVDTSGEALFKRGWRDDQGEAPLKETLAAALLAAADWRGRDSDGALLDPCCGAGTIAIEAAQIACGIAPGMQRRFAFERQMPFRDLERDWHELHEAARAAEHAPAVPVFASDVAFRMTDFTMRNAQRAGVAHALEVKTVDALQRPAPAERGTLIVNPPYGERIGAKGARGDRPVVERDADGAGTPAAFFAQLAAHWKRHYAGWTAWVLSPDAKLPTVMRLKESRRVPLWNGPIECRLFRFDMVAGSARRPRADDAATSAERSR
ncbi:class I SAM-dependent RNA methyltransferase [Candidatus Binatia bacterium]|jgi:putative N6-adenine-specific DNA methylase|nr:class I SAM-dependent RNA methyltransferase [Candidatus Binatia bacterium]